MASADIMRDYVKKQYGGNWSLRVARMPDSQVASIYRRMINAENHRKTSNSASLKAGVDNNGNTYLYQQIKMNFEGV